MKFNLLGLRRIYVDSGPYKSLSEDDLELLRDGDLDTVGITVTGETLAVIADLGARHRLDNLKYYRNAATLENISLFGKQGEDASYLWEEISYTDMGDHLLADLSGVDDRYEFLKVVHTVITDSATVYELEAVTDDGEISFGPTGEATVYSVDSGTNTLFPEAVQIYNPTSDPHTFFCLPDGEDQDSVGLSVGATSSGIFTVLHDSGISIPKSFPWSSGEKQNVSESGSDLVLTSGTSGTFYTPVMDVSVLEGRRLFWYATLSGSNVIDDTSRDDSVPTISVRFSNETPTDGGWVSGQLSTDPNWSTSSGILPWEPHDNYQILHPKYLNYFQARIEFESPLDGESPILHSLGIEEALAVDINPSTYETIYVKSIFDEHVFGRKSNLLVWFFESSNEEQ